MKWKKEKCLYPECHSMEYTRGLCEKHYNKAFILVRDGKVTWNKLEEEGKVKKSTREWIKTKNWFLQNPVVY
jgi:hypothetical protein